MALVKCPECNEDVSDKALMCPHCGYNVKEHFQRIKEEETKDTQNDALNTQTVKTNQSTSDVPEGEYEEQNTCDGVLSVNEIKRKEELERIEKENLQKERGIIREKPKFSIGMCGYLGIVVLLSLGILADAIFDGIDDGAVLAGFLCLILSLYIPLFIYLYIYWYKWDQYKKYMADPEGYKKQKTEEWRRRNANSSAMLRRIGRAMGETPSLLTCPVCHSSDVKRITAMNRASSVAMFGVASSKIGKQYECKNCGHKW